MSNVISFLESVGQDAALRHAGKDELELALTNAQIAPELQAAILNSDQAQLEALLGAKTNVVCAILPGKEDDDEGEEAPSKDDDEITAKALPRIVAAAG
jgi:hypothetical protein